MVTRHTISVRATAVAALSAGAGAPLVFLHAPGEAGRWSAFHDWLAERFSVWLPSHPGHGDSPEADWIEHISDLAFHYLDLLDELALPQVHLVGASFGGWIAAELATIAGHRLRSLVLIDPVGIKVDGWIYPFLFTLAPAELTAMLLHDATDVREDPASDSIEGMIGVAREQAALARVAWNPHLYDPLLRRRLARITTPTLLCWGEHDRVAPVGPCAAAWQQSLPHAQLEIVPDAGHLPHWEWPTSVAATVTDFCAGQEPSA